MPVQAARIDRTLDDGYPDTGAVVAQSTANQCRAEVNEYAYRNNSQSCVIAYALPRQ